jgi:hypothetical protein
VKQLHSARLGVTALLCCAGFEAAAFAQSEGGTRCGG